MNAAADSQDFLISAELVAAIEAPLANPNANLLAMHNDLRITELMYNPPDTESREFLELRNTGTSELNLEGVRFSAGFDFVLPRMTLGAGEYLVIARDLGAFRAFYGTGINALGSYDDDALGNGGEDIILRLPDPYDAAILRFEYDDVWYPTTDGGGHAMSVVSDGARRSDWSVAAHWQAGPDLHGSPGRADGQAVTPSVVINEILSHTDDPLADAIELYNPTGADVNVGGWWLSDSDNNFLKFRIPADTIVPAGGYRTFHEGHYVGGILVADQATEFGGPGVDDFALSSAHGDDVWLVQADAAGNVTQFVDYVSFPAAANGEAYGRWPNGLSELVPMVNPTLDAANSGPATGALFISEVHYNPPEGEDMAFIEVTNPTAVSVNLWEVYNVGAGPRDYPWQVEGYPFTARTTLAAGESLVVVSFDPVTEWAKLSAFKARYGLAASPVQIVGSYGGNLDNGSETIRLERPDEPPAEEPDFTPYLHVDAVTYNDSDPWPASADALGDSLNRAGAGAWGNDAASWTAAPPTPGFYDSNASATPSGVDLLAASDSGASDVDNITNLDNHDAAAALQFEVVGTVAGATVTLYANGVEVGSALAAGATTTITTNGTVDLADGFHVMTARQLEGGKSPSAAGGGLAVMVDTSAPTATVPDLADASDTGASNSDDVTQGIMPQFDGTADDTGSGVWKVDVISDDAKSATDSAAPFYSAVLPTLDEGVRSVTATVHDMAGNSFTTAGLTVTVDRAAPPQLTWDGADGAEWTSGHWGLGPLGPSGGEAMAVDSGTVRVSSDLTTTPGAAASLDIANGAPGGTVDIGPAGELLVTGDVNVGVGGTLSIDGELTSAAVNVAGGLLTNSRNSAAALAVNGDVTLDDGAMFMADVAGAGVDTLVAGGAVAIGPYASLEIVISGGGNEFMAGTYTLIRAGGGLSGTFAEVTVLGGYVSVNGNGLTYDEIAGTLTLTLDMDLNPADGNLDGQTDVSDRIIWNNNNFTYGTTFATGDYNNDGQTDVSDRIVWNNNNFTFATAPQPAPPPAAQAPGAVLTTASPSAPTDSDNAVPPADALPADVPAPSPDAAGAALPARAPSPSAAPTVAGDSTAAPSEAQLVPDLSSPLTDLFSLKE